MKIVNVRENIEDLDGCVIGRFRVDIDLMITQVEKEHNIKGLLDHLKKIKNDSSPDITYLKVIEDACFYSLTNEKDNFGKFVDGLKLVERLRSEDDFTEGEIISFKGWVIKTGFSPLAKALTLRKLDEAIIK